MSASMISPHGSQQTGRSAANALIMARLDLVDQKMKLVSDLEAQVDEHQRQIAKLNSM